MKLLPNTLALATLLLAAPAFAQTPPPASTASAQDLAIAEAAFTEGVKLAAAGNCKDAIAKFEVSMKVDPASGTALNLGVCYEQVGRTGSAYAAFSQAAVMARAKANEKIRAQAQASLDALAGKLSYLDLKFAAGVERPKGLTIVIDGKAASADAVGFGVPVDPGTHEVVLGAPGKVEWKTTVVVAAKAGKETVEVPAFKDAPVEKPIEAPSPPPGMSTGVKAAVIGLAAAGAVGIGVGVVFGVDALDKNAASKDLCQAGDPNKCSQAGIDMRNQAYSAATISNVGVFAGAGALVAAGGVLLVSKLVLEKPGPKKDAAKGVALTSVGVGPGNVVLEGKW